MYNVSNTEIEVATIEAIRELLRQEIDWEHKFGVTQRKNNTIVVGNPRDTIDEGDIYRGINVRYTGRKLTIVFTDESATEVFGDRAEIDQLVLDSIMGNLAGLIVENLLKSRVS